MQTDRAIELCNRALSDLGERAIASFDDGSVAAIVAKQRYEAIAEELLSLHRWGFASIQTELSRYTDFSPLVDWEYAYQMPTMPKFLRMIRFAYGADSLASVDSLVWPVMRGRRFAIRAIRTAGDESIPVYEHAIFSNNSEAFIEYIGRVEETLWPPHFDACVVTALTEAFAPAVRGGPGLQIAEAMNDKLHGRRGRPGQMARAKVVDSRNSPSMGIVDDAGFISGR